MEQLIQKYIRYFYITLIGVISIQLFDVIITTLGGAITCEIFILIFLSIMNIILLGDSMKHNMKQQFTECKATAKILRFTMALFIVFQALLCFSKSKDILMLGTHLMTVVIIEIILDYRIKSIEYLEKLALQYTKDNTFNQQKGG